MSSSAYREARARHRGDFIHRKSWGGEGAEGEAFLGKEFLYHGRVQTTRRKKGAELLISRKR